MSRRPQATVTVAAPVFALVALIAVASRGASVWAPARRGTFDRVEILVTLVVLFGVLLSAVALVTSAVHRAIITRRADPPSLRATLLGALPITTVAFGVIGLLAITGADAGPATEPGSRDAPELPGRPSNPFDMDDWWSSAVVAAEGGFASEEEEGSEPEPASRIPPLLILIGAVAAAAGCAVWWYAGSRKNHGEAETEGDREAAHGAVIGLIDAMLADPDPRRAIIGAYARLLEGMAAWGTPRRDYEGPIEHLQRALTILDVRPSPSRRLVDLFEIARFSTHPLTSEHREQALRALREVATDLEAGRARSPTW